MSILPDVASENVSSLFQIGAAHKEGDLIKA